MVSVILNKQDSVCGNISHRQKRVLPIQISILTEDDHTWSATGLNFGPLLFLIYINELPLYIQEAKLILYADDTNVLITDYSQEALQTKLFLIMKQLETFVP